MGTTTCSNHLRISPPTNHNTSMKFVIVLCLLGVAAAQQHQPQGDHHLGHHGNPLQGFTCDEVMADHDDSDMATCKFDCDKFFDLSVHEKESDEMCIRCCAEKYHVHMTHPPHQHMTHPPHNPDNAPMPGQL